MRWLRSWMRFRLSTLGVLVALCAFGMWGGLYFFSPTRRITRLIQADQPTYLRREAVIGLGYVPFWEAEEAIDILIGALNDPSPRVRENALSGLGSHRVRARRAVPAIMKSLDDKDSSVRFTAYSVLGKIMPPDGKRPEREAVVAALKEALNDPNAQNRLAAAMSLLKLRETRAALPTIALAATEPGDQYLRPQARIYMDRHGKRSDLIAWVVPLVRDGNEARRLAAIGLLIEIAPPATVNAALRSALEDDSPEVRRWAAAKLESITPGPEKTPKAGESTEGSGSREDTAL